MPIVNTNDELDLMSKEFTINFKELDDFLNVDSDIINDSIPLSIQQQSQSQETHTQQAQQLQQQIPVQQLQQQHQQHQMPSEGRISKTQSQSGSLQSLVTDYDNFLDLNFLNLENILMPSYFNNYTTAIDPATAATANTTYSTNSPITATTTPSSISDSKEYLNDILSLQEIQPKILLEQPQFFNTNNNIINNSIKEGYTNNEPIIMNTNIPKIRGRKPSLINDASKHFACQFCTRRFKRQEHLKRHVRSLHMGERPFHCQICLKKFSRSDNLNQHMKTHNNNNNNNNNNSTTTTNNINNTSK